MNRKTIFGVSLASVLIIGVAGYAGFAMTRPSRPAAQAPQTVAVTTCDVQQSISAPGNLVNTHTVAIEMPADGSLVDILVQPGDSIKSGAPLARLANPSRYAMLTAQAELATLQAQVALDTVYANAPSRQAQLKSDLIDAQDALERAEARRTALGYPRASDLTLRRAASDVAQAQQAYDEAQDGYDSTVRLDPAHPDRIAAQNALAAAQQQLDQARANLNWYVGDPSASDFARADATVATAAAEVAEIQASLDFLQNGVDPIEEAQARATLATAQSQLEQAKRVGANGEIRAPFGGVVLGVSVRAGEALQAGEAILTLGDPKALEVEANVTEEDYPLLAPGLKVDLFFDARPDVTVQGRLERLVPKRIEGDRPLYNIYISLKEVPDGLVEGMTADSAVTIAERAGVLCLPRAIVRASGTTQTVVDVWDGVQTVSREIGLGLRGDAYIEIVSGLKEGEMVVTR